MAGDGQLGRLLREAASSLVQDLPRSFARVTLLSKEKNQLINCAVHQIRADGIDLRKETRFSLDRLPWHRLTLSARRPMVVNQDDPESLMSQQEARLIMDERINSAILVPVMLHDSPVGIISVGEMRNWGRQPLTEEEITFVKHKADQLSLALKEALLRRSNEHL
ncbi:MAG: GAF domain-containing protein, partial [Armatimonadetes bacterium]|nr:GAF domain-containing protein [Armatimonadota bacterium]NIO98185.1 GAF domain-containing protein [Armatimonadota bacterium]